MRSATIGNRWESVVHHILVLYGFHHVRKIHTGMRKARGIWVHSKKVDGDFTAIADGGRHVLVECKAYPERFSLSYLEPHQKANLNDVAACGGLALVAWCETKSRTVYLMPWPLKNIAKGKRLTPEEAHAQALTRDTNGRAD